MLAYLKMLAINRIAGWKPSSYGKAGESKVKTVLKYVGLTVLALYLLAVLVLLEMLLYDTGMGVGEPQLLIAVTFLICTVVTLFYSFFYVVSIMFFSKDTSFLAAMPISSHGILTAKLLMVVAGEIGITLLVGAPMLIRFGIDTGANVWYYVRALIGTMFVPLAPIALSTLLACLLIRVSALWKRRESMTIIMTFALMAALIYFQMNMSMNAAEGQMDQIVIQLLFMRGSITDVLLKSYLPMQWLVGGITGSGAAAWGNIGLFAVVSSAALGVIVLLFGGRYLRLALKQQESIRRKNNVRRKLGADRVRKPFWAFFRQEMREVITVPVYATNCLTGCVMFPVMIVIMLVSMGNRLEGISELANAMLGLPSSLLIALMTAGMSLTTIMGMAVSTSVSREGKQHEMRKTFPVSGFTHLSAKLLMGLCYNFITAVFCAIALWVLMPALWWHVLIGLALSQLFSLMSCLLGLILDTYRAKLDWKTETEAVKQSFNSFLSMLISLAALVMLCGAVYLLITYASLSITWAFWIAVALMAIGDDLLMHWLRGKASVAYFLR